LTVGHSIKTVQATPGGDRHPVRPFPQDPPWRRDRRLRGFRQGVHSPFLSISTFQTYRDRRLPPGRSPGL